MSGDACCGRSSDIEGACHKTENRSSRTTELKEKGARLLLSKNLEDQTALYQALNHILINSTLHLPGRNLFGCLNAAAELSAVFKFDPRLAAIRGTRKFWRRPLIRR